MVYIITFGIWIMESFSKSMAFPLNLQILDCFGYRTLINALFIKAFIPLLYCKGWHGLSPKSILYLSK